TELIDLTNTNRTNKDVEIDWTSSVCVKASLVIDNASGLLAKSTNDRSCGGSSFGWDRWGLNGGAAPSGTVRYTPALTAPATPQRVVAIKWVRDFVAGAPLKDPSRPGVGNSAANPVPLGQYGYVKDVAGIGTTLLKIEAVRLQANDQVLVNVSNPQPPQGSQ